MAKDGLNIDAARLEEASARADSIVETLRRELRIDVPMSKMSAEVYLPLTL